MKKYVVCFLFNKELTETLLILKSRKIYAGMYNGLGGKIEENETAKEATIREVFEESNGAIKLTNPKHLVSEIFPISEEVPINNGILLEVFYDVIDKIKVEDNEEGKIEWLPVDFALDIKNKQLAGDGNLPYFIFAALKNEEVIKNIKENNARNDRGTFKV